MIWSITFVKLIVYKDKVVIFPKENKKTWCEVPYTEEMDWDIAQIERKRCLRVVGYRRLFPQMPPEFLTGKVQMV